MTKRKPIAKLLVGSHNYNLNNEKSDKDYKLLVSPTYDDLYNGTSGHVKTTSSIGDTEDVETHDIRRLPHLLDRANVNFIEMLFSVDVEVYDDDLTNYYLSQILMMRDDLARMNLPYLYNASFGMYLEQYKKWSNGDYVDHKKGYQALRILDFLVRFERGNFESFKDAIFYDDNDPMREYLLEVKAGRHVWQNVNVSLASYEHHVKLLRPSYMSHERNEATKLRLDQLVYDMVKREIKSELLF